MQQNFLYDINNDQVVDYNGASVGRQLQLGTQKMVGLGVFYTYTEKLLTSMSIAGYGVQGTVPDNQWKITKLYGKLHEKLVDRGVKLFSGLDDMSIHVTDLDLGWLGYNKSHKQLFPKLGEYIDQIGKAVSDDYASMTGKQFQKELVDKYANASIDQLSDPIEKQVAQNIQEYITKKGGGEIGKKQAVNTIRRTMITSTIAKGVLQGLHYFQVYQMADMQFGLAKVAVDYNVQQQERRNQMKYYRRLAGLTGAIQVERRNDLSYTSFEDNVLMRNVQNQMVLRVMLNDQGIFGSNPYQDYYI